MSLEFLSSSFGDAIEIARLRVYVFQTRVDPPIRSSFGIVNERSTLLVSLADKWGNEGWAEIWSGMPAFGAMHRAALVINVLAPHIVGYRIESPAALQERLATITLPITRLAGEPGPVAQIIAGIDCSLWDLTARRQKIPLYALLSGSQSDLKIYASGLAPDVPKGQVDWLRENGFRAFKLKAGFDDERTLPLIAGFGESLERDESLMIDANCGWTAESAKKALALLSSTKLEWIEEPIGPESGPDEWRQIRSATHHRLAAGENLMSLDAFDQASEWLAVVQPDLGKWGGITKILSLGKQLRASGKMFCPHTFGSNIGIAHAAHVLAAVGGDGFLEIDANCNPLRSISAPAFRPSLNGRVRLNDQYGIGPTPDLDSHARFLRHTSEVAI